MDKDRLAQMIIDLHYIARNRSSDEMRQIADALSEEIKKWK